MLVTATGWTLEYIDQLGMDRVWEHLAYLQEWPPAHVILNQVHRDPDATGAKLAGGTHNDEASDLNKLAGSLGASGKARPLPARLKNLADEAKRVEALLKKSK